jgi:hypothetical protein
MMISLFLIVLAIVALIVVIACWAAHLEMTRSRNYPCGWGTYRTFKREFHKLKWKANPSWESSLFNGEDGCGYNDNYLHAAIFKFGGRGMMMRTPWDYILASLLIRKEAKKLLYKQSNKIKW